MIELKEIMAMLNQHWEGFFELPIYKRKLFNKIVGLNRYPLIGLITGPRRVGKTTILKQYIDHLLSTGIPKKHILYFSFEQKQTSILELFKEWETILAKKISGQGYYLILDEVQYAKKWAEEIKLLYDHRNIKILLSGSSAIQLSKTSEMLAGRVKEYFLGPLSFTEYCEMLNLECSEDQLRFFLFRQLPALALHKHIDPAEYVNSIINKVIIDLNVNSSAIEELITVLFSSPGQLVNLEKLSKELSLSKPTLANYLHLLEKAFIFRKLYNFTGNRRKSEIKLKKFYPFYTTLLAYKSLNLFVPESLIVESEVASVLNAEFFYNHKGKEIDFIFPHEKIAIEVKWRNLKRKIPTLPGFTGYVVDKKTFYNLEKSKNEFFENSENIQSKDHKNK